MLDDFRSQRLKWDKANNKFDRDIEGHQGDSNGRKLEVQVVDGNLVVNTSGINLSLAWKGEKNEGLDAFTLIDEEKGLYEIYYSRELLSNVGRVSGSLVLVDSKGRIESKIFNITINKTLVNDEMIESENSFTALTTALVELSKVNVDNLLAIEDAELLRISNEEVRVSSESQRNQSEVTRINAESDRQVKESTRESNESTRESNENSRKTEEQSRVALYNKLKNTENEIKDIVDGFLTLPDSVYVSENEPPNPQEGDIWFKVTNNIYVDIPPITDYNFRFDAKKLDLDNNVKVAEWKDASENEYVLTQGTSGLQPTFLENGLNDMETVKFDGSKLDMPYTIAEKKSVTLFMVAQLDGRSDSSVLCTFSASDSTGLPFALRLSGSTQELGVFLGSQTARIATNSNPTIFAATYNGNNVAISDNHNRSHSVSHTANIGTQNLFVVGAMATGIQSFDARVSEIVFFERVLSTAEIAKMNSYLSNKWGF